MSLMNKSAHAATSAQAVLTLIDVGQCAIDYAEAVRARDEAQQNLRVAYDLFKGVPEEFAGCPGYAMFCEDAIYVERETAEWDSMMEATAKQYDVLRKAKSKVRRVHAKLLKITAQAA